LRRVTLTLILPSESVYGSQFLTSKLLEENKFEENEANMYSSSVLWRFIIYLPNSLKSLLSIAFNTFILEKIEIERLFIPQVVGADCRLFKNANVWDPVPRQW
jgi:hypothetical protein